MVDVVPFFPIFNLSNNALMNVLHNMEIIPKIGLSILSERAKNLVKSLHLKSTNFSACITNIINFDITVSNTQKVRWTFFKEENQNIQAGMNDQTVELPIPDSVKIQCYNRGEENETYEWNNQTFSIKQWIDHLMFLFNQSKIELIWFREGCDRYDVKLLRNLFNDYMIIWINDGCPHAYAKQILKTFLHVKELMLDENPFVSLKDIHNVFSQNFDQLECCNLWFIDDNTRFGLDDMLIINSLYIEFSNSTLSNKELNRFIKHWINGSNPRMEHLQVHFFDNRIENEALDERAILKGVVYTIAPPDDERVRNTSFGFAREEIKGIFDFHRKDGTNATIFIKPYTIQMFVWN